MACKEPSMTDPVRDPGYSSDYEEEKPVGDGRPPRPAQEPAGSRGSSNSGETATDPATGEPNR
ncbi:hypothetical protein IP78_03740 [Brevundimonas sp. AAP58]|nr:hypothetical protein IP78_03740 [Brevundimonas sp. AAP58]